MDIFLWVGFALLVVFVGYFIYKGKKAKELEERLKMENYLSEFNRIGETYLANGIPSITSDIKLMKEENLRAVLRGAQWMEYRKVATGRSTSHGIGGRVKIAKGLYYRYGVSQTASERLDLLKAIDSGDLYFTNQRIIFRGGTGNKNIPFDKIRKVSPTMVGLKIERESGKDVYLPFQLSAKDTAAIALTWEAYETRTS